MGTKTVCVKYTGRYLPLMYLIIVESLMKLCLWQLQDENEKKLETLHFITEKEYKWHIITLKAKNKN